MDPAWFGRLPPPKTAHTIVAWTAGWRGRLGPFGGEENDGIVAVAETLVMPDDRPIRLPALHRFLIHSRAVHRPLVKRL